MGVTEEASAQRFDKAAWAVALAAALVLNVSGWFLPITGGMKGLKCSRFVHEIFWKLITEGRSIDSASDVLGGCSRKERR